jgi:hypothetical protein
MYKHCGTHTRGSESTLGLAAGRGQLPCRGAPLPQGHMLLPRLLQASSAACESRRAAATKPGGRAHAPHACIHGDAHAHSGTLERLLQHTTPRACTIRLCLRCGFAARAGGRGGACEQGQDQQRHLNTTETRLPLPGWKNARAATAATKRQQQGRARLPTATCGRCALRTRERAAAASHAALPGCT